MNTKRILQIQNFSIITGILFLFVFGSTLIFILLQKQKNETIQNELMSSQSVDFCLLEGQLKKRFLNLTHYYFSYSGNHRGTSFMRIEKVDQDYFHLNSPGKNVEVKIYSDTAGNLHTLLQGNRVHYGIDLSGIETFTWIFIFIGFVFFLAGFLLRMHTGKFSDSA